MNLRFPLALIVVLFAASVVSACGGEGNGRAAERLSRPEAIARIDELCRQTLERIERVGPQPAVGSGTRPALDRYERWLARVLAVTEAGLRQVERVPVPDDARQREIRNTLSRLYKPGQAYGGGTAGALREEARTGIKIFGRNHRASAEQNVNALKRIVAGQRGPLSARDRYTALRNLRDLQDAIRFFDSKRPDGYIR